MESSVLTIERYRGGDKLNDDEKKIFGKSNSFLQTFSSNPHNFVESYTRVERFRCKLKMHRKIRDRKSYLSFKGRTAAFVVFAQKCVHPPSHDPGFRAAILQ